MAQAGHKALCDAITANDEAAFAAALANEPEAARHWKPIVDAAFQGKPAFVRALVDAGADVNVVSGTGSRHTPLTRITQHHATIPKHPGHLATLELLLDLGADPDLAAGPLGFAPLVYAAMAPSTTFIETLVNANARVDVCIAAALVDRTGLKLLANDGAATQADEAGRTPLQFVALSGLWKEAGSAPAIDCAAFLLDAGAAVDAASEIDEGGEVFQTTPLWWTVAWQGHFALAQFLLSRGADPNPAVFAATFHGDPAICDLLHARGANWNQRSHGRTPLMDLMHYKKSALAAWLVDHGADVNARDPDGRTALHYAAFQGVREDVIRTLIAAGADKTMQDAQGKTALDLAREKNRKKATAALR